MSMSHCKYSYVHGIQIDGVGGCLLIKNQLSSSVDKKVM